MIRGWLIRKRIKSIQQEKTKLFFLQISDQSTQTYNSQVVTSNSKVPLNYIDTSMNRSSSSSTKEDSLDDDYW